MRLAEIGASLGAAIASLVNVFDPEVVVIGGGFGDAAGELLSSRPRTSLAARRSRRGRDAPRRCPPSSGVTRGSSAPALVGFEALDGAW